MYSFDRESVDGVEIFTLFMPSLCKSFNGIQYPSRSPLDEPRVYAD